MPRFGSHIEIPDDAIRIQFVHASGPGGQHVNKVATAVELRLLLERSGLSLPVKARLRDLAGSRMTRNDELVIFAQESRSQLRNRMAALQRLERLLIDASQPPKRRIPTRPSRAAKRARLDGKKRRGGLKSSRSKPRLD